MGLSVSVVMPAYNESEHIVKNLIEVVETFEAFGNDFEVIVIDDGSSDGTRVLAARALLAHPERVRVAHYDTNQGKGNALIAGTGIARGEYVVFLDADMDLHPKQLPRFFAIMQARNADAVIGAKWHPESVLTYPRFRRFCSKAYFAMVRLLFGLPLRDTQTGLKVFKMALLRDVFPRVLAKRFAFDIEVLAIAHSLGYKIVDAPVTMEFKRQAGRLRLRDAWPELADTVAIFWRLKVLHTYDRARGSECGNGGELTELTSESARDLVGEADQAPERRSELEQQLHERDALHAVDRT